MTEERAIWHSFNLILPEYKDYIDKDNSIEQDTKRIRKQSADECMKLIEKLIREG